MAWMAKVLRAIFGVNSLVAGREHAQLARSRVLIPSQRIGSQKPRPARALLSAPAQPQAGTDGIGRTDPVCPSCELHLGRMPEHKTRCPRCAKLLYVRTRPTDLQRVLLTKAELPAIRDQWARVRPEHAKLMDRIPAM